MARCKQKLLQSSSSSKLEDKFARMCLTQSKTDVKPYKKKISPSIASSKDTNDDAVAVNDNPLIPWNLYQYMRRVGKVSKRLEAKQYTDHYDNIRAQLEVKNLETAIQTIIYVHKLSKRLPSDWQYDRASAMTLERIDRWERDKIFFD